MIESILRALQGAQPAIQQMDANRLEDQGFAMQNQAMSQPMPAPVVPAYRTRDAAALILGALIANGLGGRQGQAGFLGGFQGAKEQKAANDNQIAQNEFSRQQQAKQLQAEQLFRRAARTREASDKTLKYRQGVADDIESKRRFDATLNQRNDIALQKNAAGQLKLEQSWWGLLSKASPSQRAIMARMKGLGEDDVNALMDMTPAEIAKLAQAYNAQASGEYKAQTAGPMAKALNAAAGERDAGAALKGIQGNRITELLPGEKAIQNERVLDSQARREKMKADAETARMRAASFAQNVESLKQQRAKSGGTGTDQGYKITSRLMTIAQDAHKMARQDLKTAKKAYDDALLSKDPAEMEDAKAALQDANAAYTQTKTEYETAKAGITAPAPVRQTPKPKPQPQPTRRTATPTRKPQTPVTPKKKGRVDISNWVIKQK